MLRCPLRNVGDQCDITLIAPQLFQKGGGAAAAPCDREFSTQGIDQQIECHCVSMRDEDTYFLRIHRDPIYGEEKQFSDEATAIVEKQSKRDTPHVSTRVDSVTISGIRSEERRVGKEC